MHADSQAREREAATQQEIAALKTRSEILEGEAAAAYSARLEAEALRDTTLNRMADLEAQVAALKTALQQAKHVPAAGAARGSRAEPDVARFATDKPVIYKAKKAEPKDYSGVPRPSTEHDKSNRREERVSSRIRGTIQKDTELTVLQCTILDKSSTGAKIEITPDPINPAIGMPVEGEAVTLKFGTAFETSTVSGQVVWMSATECGIHFNGPPHVEFVTMPKRSTAKSSKDDNDADKGARSKRGNSRRKSAFL